MTSLTEIEGVYWIHQNLLQDNQSINAMIEVRMSSGTSSIHIIGSRYSSVRGRYIFGYRTENVLYTARITDSGMNYTQLENGEVLTYTP